MSNPFNPGGKKTILTIDGGGARGIIPLMALLKLEAETGQTCHELFDFVGGTSVGALIAAGLAVGRTAAEMIELYERFIQTIFKIDYLRVLFRHGLRYIYDKTAMRDLLREYVGEVRLGDVEKAVLITVKDMARAETIFFVNKGPGAALVKDFSLIQVAEASASAPVYFQPMGDAVDGGVGAYGNVCYVTTVEAMVYLSQDDPSWLEPDNVIHCSYGTGIPSNRHPRGAVKQWLPLGWPLWIIGEGLDEAMDVNVQVTVRHYDDRIDFRRYQLSLMDDVVRYELGVPIPPGLKSNDLGLDSASPAQVELMKEIGRAFAENLDFSLTGQELHLTPPLGSAGYPYRSRLPALTTAELQAMFDA